ncbi:MAG: hypothetical protein J0H88_09545 [Sphingomonadales bacterium]|nr:hypothetical protein [Sphingomonadales bacterium]
MAASATLWLLSLAVGAITQGHAEYFYLIGLVAGMMMIASAAACVFIQSAGWFARRRKR